MTLWIFGDNFFQNNNNSSQWMNILVNELQTDIQSLAKFGSALEFTYQRFNLARKKIQPNDIIIIGLTNFNRRWFFKNYPEFAEQDCSPTGDKKENKAIKLFRKYLDHKEIHQVYLTDFLYNVESLVDEIGVHVIIVPCYKDVEDYINNKSSSFPLLHFAKGNLSNLFNINSNEELNFLSIENHKLISQRLYQNIKNKDIITL